MTVQQIKEAYPQATVPEKGPMDYGMEGGEKLTAPLILKSFEIADCSFSVRFVVGEKSGLKRVILMRKTSETTEWDFKKIEALLTRKYGPASSQEPSTTGQGMTTSWLPHEVSIKLVWLAIMVDPMEYYLNLIYSKPDSESLKKL